MTYNAKQINNKTIFEIYLIFRFIIFISIIIIGGIIITKVVFKINFLQILFLNYGSAVMNPLILINWFSMIFFIIDEKIKPAFIEFHVTDTEIYIKTYNPHSNRWESPFVLFGYKKRLKELKISRTEYNNYTLTIGKFGFKKEIKLQKANDTGFYESSNINISLLGQKNYTNLLLGIDRLRTKICLN